MCKGADSVIEERLSTTSLESEDFHKTKASVDEYAEEGLRTLFLAEKMLDRGDYDLWED